MRSTLSPLLLLASYGPPAFAWSFSVEIDPEATCMGVNLGWSGGTPPYTFTFIHPPNVAPSNISDLTSWVTGMAGSAVEQQAHPVSSGGQVFGWGRGWDFAPLVIVASDASGFGSGGTSEAFTAQPETTLPGCAMDPNNNTTYLTYLEAFDTNFTTCSAVTARVNVTALASSMIYVDTIVPLGQSYRTVLNASASNGLLSWPVTVTAGTNVSFVFSTSNVPGFDDKQFVTPLMMVQPGNTSCQATGTLSSASAIATSTYGVRPNGSPASGGMVGSTLLVLLPAVIAAVVLGMFRP
ncbi:hypothetical protein CALVIDRAFT_403123 [Calocera viscosa TUFC12733]|uniref:Uncharacterized protein n=1 Tax=Calocera viscosa (strain TUFC12733) TaxID=1330018 RepID=A0A167PTP7_CALVF|nr:hypothetical protein CALVIDRAFT_403123 [Calocera viscosa TUFC12733]